MTESLETRETWLRASRLAERKVRIAEDALKLGAIALVLAFFRIWWGVGLVLVLWGSRLLRDFHRLVLAPRLRERFVQEEVEREVQAGLTRERQQLQGDHARSLEQLSASIAHEIRNPITAAKSLVQQMEEEPGARENVEYARVALEELERVERSISHLLRFGRDEEIQWSDLRLAEVLDSALETFRERLARSGIALERQVDCEGALRGDAEKLRRVAINLVGNAIDALEESKTPEPRIEVSVGESLAGSAVWMRIRDNGPGIDPEAAPRIWSAFTTSKRNGTGLGLAIARKLVDAHGGTLELESGPGRGAAFVVSLPRQPAPGGCAA